MEKKDAVMTVLAVGLIMVALLLALKSKTSVVVEQNGLRMNTLSVSGTGTISVEPDKAEIYVRIVTLEKTAQLAKDRNSEAAASVTKALKGDGVKDKDIETYQFSIYPKYEYEDVIAQPIRKTRQILTGYEVANVMKITTLDLEKAGKLIDDAVNSGANEIERVSFGLTKDKEKEVKQQAMIMASDDAGDKAVALATNTGVSLGKPVSISESSFAYQPLNIYAAAGLAKGAEISISPQKLDVSATISITYEIR